MEGRPSSEWGVGSVTVMTAGTVTSSDEAGLRVPH